MGRIDKVTEEANGKYPYYVEVLNDGNWTSEVRYYELKQNVSDFPDNVRRRNFKYLGKDDN
tara:strand:+ start:3465 stop:3647 length:183 start_codon:yes stop_codon:yes gene_type:complete